LEETKSPKSPISFHVHTEPGNVIPQESGTKAARKDQASDMKKATGILDRLIGTLRKLISVVTKIIVAKRSGNVPEHP
jgi:hypothetical protein